MLAQELFRGIGYEWNQKGSLAVPVGKVTSDSRKVERGDIFVAVRGAVQDGHLFVRHAIEKGAQMIVLESGCATGLDAVIPTVLVPDSKKAFQSILLNCYRERLELLKLIGVTGTNGKTTTAYLIQFLLNQFSSCGMIGTVEYIWNHHHVKAGNTTPGLETLLDLLAQMVREEVNYCVSEVSSHALDQGRVAGLWFDTAIFTNLTQDHLDYHKDFERYYAAKKKLFLSEPAPRVSVVNIDDSYGKKLFSEIHSNKLSFGATAGSQFLIQNVMTSLSGAEFDVLDKSHRYHIQSPLPLLHNVYNLTGALTAVNVFGFEFGTMIDLLPRFSGVPGRMQPVKAGQSFDVFVDYAHTPDAFQNVFSSVKPHVSGKLICVFGCGGNRDRLKRPLMGQIAAQYSDCLFLTNDNPRTEDPNEILHDIKQGINSTQSDKISEIPDRHEAIERALSLAKKGDVVLILGKGHESEQVIGDEVIPFNDHAVANNFLAKMKANHL